MLERVTIGLLWSTGTALGLGSLGCRGYALSGLAAAVGALAFAATGAVERWERRRRPRASGAVRDGRTDAALPAPRVEATPAVGTGDALAGLNGDVERELRAAGFLR